MTDGAFVIAVEASMRAELARTPVATPALRLVDAGGKRLRARLLWWAANAATPHRLDPAHPTLVRAATAVEFAHLGSLIHDDVVDGSDTRRGVATVHREHGVRVATDAGAALAHLASELVATLGSAPRAAVRRALLATCRGQLRELAVPFVVLPARARLVIMQEKTGAFFELAATLGALVGGAPRPAHAAIARFARRFGVAFQIADDVLDLAGDPCELGRANGADLRDGVLTLPVLLAADRSPALHAALRTLRAAPTSDRIAECAAAITDAGGIQAASAASRWWLARAFDALRSLPQNEPIDALIELAQKSIARGLRPGTVRFAAAGLTTSEARPATLPLADPLHDPCAATPVTLDPTLTRTLEWFHPGLAAMIAARAQCPEVSVRRTAFEQGLRRGNVWSRRAETAADAVALAHALTDDDALRRDPVRTLATVDALHCAAIALLARTPNAREHERMAARARGLARRPIPSPSRSYVSDDRAAVVPT